MPPDPGILTGNDRAPAEWQPAGSAPFGRDLELAVMDRDGLHALVFPCRRSLAGWSNGATGQRIEVSPTHWRDWQTRSPSSAGR